MWLALYVPVAAIMAFDLGLLVFLAWAYHAPAFASHRISPLRSMKISPYERLTNIAVNGTLSAALMFGFTLALLQAGGYHDRPTGPLALVGHAVLVILLYDLIYYWMHRAMHHPRLMRFVHAVHHRVRNRSSLESFYLHPAELFAGLFLLHFSVWALGPVHVYSYALVFFVHSTLNIIVHCGMVSRHWLLAPLDLLVRKHTVHHKDDFGRNFASLTPLPDLLFGTSG